jgi:hypothetical protein
MIYAEHKGLNYAFMAMQDEYISNRLREIFTEEGIQEELADILPDEMNEILATLGYMVKIKMDYKTSWTEVSLYKLRVKINFKYTVELKESVVKKVEEND